MKKDYHMHPAVLCRDEADSFVTAAIEKGFDEICITDHMPLSVSAAKDRIPKGCVADYCNAVRELAKKYEGMLRIKCGIEIDYHPDFADEINAVLSAGSFDYILCSSHIHVFETSFEKYSFNDYAAYSLENQLRGIETGLFDGVSHLDMYRNAFTKPDRFPMKDDRYSYSLHIGLINELLDKIQEKNMFLEINPHFAEGMGDIVYTYPEAGIVELALEKGLRFSFGSDAHKAESVGALYDELLRHSVYKKAILKWENDN